MREYFGIRQDISIVDVAVKVQHIRTISGIEQIGYANMIVLLCLTIRRKIGAVIVR